MKIPKGGVAFFDSGIGGLTVLAECKKRLGHEIFYYYGDNKHAPYGNLPLRKIRCYVFRAFRKFRRLKVRAVVMACNTATAVCVEELRKKYTFPIIGAEPAVFTAAKYGGDVYVLATTATCKSERFQQLLRKGRETYPSARLIPIPCPTLAGEIERHITEADYNFIKLLPSGTPSRVVLGCTHYIYIKEKISSFYGCPVLDGNEGIAKRLQTVLQCEKDCLTEKTLFFRERRPLFRFDKKNHPNFDKNHEKPKAKKPNKRLRKKTKKPEKQPQKGGFSSIFFLGSQKKGNKTVYKQMFGFVCGFKNRK